MINTRRAWILLVGTLFLLALMHAAFESTADARAGRGGAGGFRGSRTFKAPARPAQPAGPAQPQRDGAGVAQQPAPFSQPGGFMRGIGTALVGGFLGSMLFSGLANAGWGGFGGSGFGLIEILLLAGLAYFILQRFRRPAAAGYGAMQYQGSRAHGWQPARPAAPAEPQGADNEIDYRSLTMMDPSFEPNSFVKTSQDLFFKIQAAWNKQDTAALANLCGPELLKTWETELAQLRARRERNHMENIALRETDITEAWTESGQDFITVRFKANLLDYDVSERDGRVVNGSNSDPVEFEEYWTFTRPVGPNAWKLSAVQQP
jgi:predicted lipid-binding transport protein (Tim44 family)